MTVIVYYWLSLDFVSLYKSTPTLMRKIEQQMNSAIANCKGGNTGCQLQRRGLFICTVTTSAHWVMTSKMKGRWMYTIQHH